MESKGYEEKSISDLCEEHFSLIIQRIKADKPSQISTVLNDEVIYIRTGEIDPVVNERGEIKLGSIKRGLSAKLWFNIIYPLKKGDEHYAHHAHLLANDVDRNLENGYKFNCYKPPVLMAARHQAGLLLKILRTLNLESILFEDRLSHQATCTVTEYLLDNMFIPELGTRLDLVHRDRD